MNKTDEQVAMILETLQDVTPKMAEQVVAMGQFIGGVGAVCCGVIAIIAVIGLIISIPHTSVASARPNSNDAWVVIAGIVGLAAFISCACFGALWVEATFAPDYYAAGRILNLFK